MSAIYLFLFVLVLVGHGTEALNYQCMVCPVGKYKSATVNNACVACPSNTYQDVLGATSASQCKPCPTNSYSPAASGSNTACLCGLGYTGNVGNYTTGVRNLNLQRSCGLSLSDACVSEQNRNQSVYVPSRAIDADLNSYSTSIMSDANNGLFYQGMTSTWWRVQFQRQAIVQQVDIYNLDATKLTSFSIRVGNIEPFARMGENALCASNVAWPAGQNSLSVTCTQAVQGQYLYIINGNSGTMFLYDVRVAGYLLPASEPCIACDTGTYKASNGTAACTACASGKASSVPAATAASTCTTCGIGTYAGAASAACTACPQYSNTFSTGSQSLSFCTCNAGYVPAPSTLSCSPFQQLYQTKRPWAHYSAENWDPQAKILADASGNNRNTKATGNRPTISLQTTADPFNRGSPNTIPYLRGTVADQLYFADNSLPMTFTICSVTRYASTSANQQRILTTTSPFWYHGHFSGMRGVARFASRTVLNAQGTVIASPVSNTLDVNIDPTSNWLVMCSKNGGVVPFNVLVDGVGSGTSTRSDGNVSEWSGTTLQQQIDAMEAGRTKNLCINCNDGQTSDWDLAQLLIWDTHLSDSEMQTVSNELRRYSMPSATACTVTPGVGCNACGPGTYNADPGSTSCTNCGAGKYRTSAAAIDERLCLACPANTFSGSGSSLLTNCSCNAGYAGVADGQMCTACAAGKFKTAVGIGSCTDCPADQYSTTPAQVTSACVSCPSFSQAPSGSDEAIDCKCNAGYSGANGAVCFACAQGTYKTAIGPDTCTLCGNNTYSSVVAASSPSVCVACQGNSTSLRGSTRQSDCHCLLGFLTNNLGSGNATCEMCSAGSYNSQLDATTCSRCGAGFKSSTPGAVSSEQCTQCGVDTYSAAGAAQCEICPNNTFAPVRSQVLTDCKCLAGYYSAVIGQDGRSCSACLPGKHKAQTGAVPCTDCPVNRYSTATAATSNATCQSCTANGVSPAGSSDSSMCLCDFGYKTYSPTISNLARSCGVNFDQACPTEVNAYRENGECGTTTTADCAMRGNDGNTRSYFITVEAYMDPTYGQADMDSWWRVDFSRPMTVTDVKLFATPVIGWNFCGADGIPNPLAGWNHPCINGYAYTGPMRITVGNTDSFNSPNNALCYATPLSVNGIRTVTCTQPVTGRFLFIHQRGVTNNGGWYTQGLLSFAEIEPIGRFPDASNACLACTAGTFKDTLGSAACTNCPENTYSGLTAQRSSATCTPCYENSVSASGSVSMDACSCVAGYEFT